MKKNKGELRILIFTLALITVTALQISHFKVLADDAKEDGIKIILSEENEKKQSIFNNDDGFWYPGKSETKRFYIENTSKYKCNINTLMIESEVFDNKGNDVSESIEEYFDENLLCSITLDDENYKNNPIYNGNFTELTKKEFKLSPNIVLSPGESKYFEITINLNQEADNRTMNLENKFNLIFNVAAENGEISNEKILSDWKELPKTGGMFDIKVLIGIGLFISILGVFMYKTKFKKTA
ncbi:MAG: LPXTG cell wall anchor domain-containing protein [Clostridiaceae bacterium]